MLNAKRRSQQVWLMGNTYWKIDKESTSAIGCWQIMCIRGPDTATIGFTNYDYPDETFETSDWRLVQDRPAKGQRWTYKRHPDGFTSSRLVMGDVITLSGPIGDDGWGAMVDGKDWTDYVISTEKLDGLSLTLLGAGPPPPDPGRFPHKCTRCGSPSYNGGGPGDIDCTNDSCPTKTLGKGTWSP